MSVQAEDNDKHSQNNCTNVLIIFLGSYFTERTNFEKGQLKTHPQKKHSLIYIKYINQIHFHVCMFCETLRKSMCIFTNRVMFTIQDNYLLLYQALEILSASKGVTLVPSPSPTRLQPNGYTNGSLGSSLPTA